MSSLNKDILNATALAVFFECLLDGPHTVFELTEESGLHLNTVRKVLRILKRHERIHVAAWEPDSMGRMTIAAFALGKKPDVKRPPGKTATERSAAMRARRHLERFQLSKGSLCVSTV